MMRRQARMWWRMPMMPLIPLPIPHYCNRCVCGGVYICVYVYVHVYVYVYVYVFFCVCVCLGVCLCVSGCVSV